MCVIKFIAKIKEECYLKKNLMDYKKETIEDYLKRTSTQEINSNLLNIKEALKNVFMRLPTHVLYDLMRPCDPVVITDVPLGASTTSFYKKRNKLDFSHGFRLLQVRVELNNCHQDIIMGVMAHEVAHIFLHCKITKDRKIADDEANNLIMDWGFKNELLRASRELNNAIKNVAATNFCPPTPLNKAADGRASED